MTYVPLYDPFESLSRENLVVRGGVHLPESVRLGSTVTIGGWRLVPSLRSAELEGQLTQEGWYFFYIPPEIRASAFGFDRKQALVRALKKLFARAEAVRVNAVEMTTAATRNFLGIHYANVSARLRHIQKSPILFETSEEDACQQKLSIAA